MFASIACVQATGLSAHSIDSKPLELSFSLEDSRILVRITHSDVFQIWDASQLEDQSVWAMTCVKVTQVVACQLPVAHQDLLPPFRLHALSTDSIDEQEEYSPLVTPPVCRVIDVERYLDMDGVGKRPGEIRLQVRSRCVQQLRQPLHVFTPKPCCSCWKCVFLVYQSI